MRFDPKTGRNLGEEEKEKEWSSSYFDLTFIGILGGVQSKLKKIDVVTCNMFLLIYLEITRGQEILLRG